MDRLPAGARTRTHSLTHSLTLPHTHIHTLTHSHTHSFSLSELIHAEVTAAWLSAVPSQRGGKCSGRMGRCGWDGGRREGGVLSAVWEDERERSERRAGNLHTHTDRRAGRQTRNHVFIRAGSPGLAVHAH